MTKNNDLTKAKDLIKELYNSTEENSLKEPLLKAYKRLDEGADIGDITTHAASAINYLRLTKKITFSTDQENWWRELRDMGSASVMFHDPKNNLLNLSDM